MLEVGLNYIYRFHTSRKSFNQVFRKGRGLSIVFISIVFILLQSLTGCSSSIQESPERITPSQSAITSTGRPIPEPIATSSPIIASQAGSTAVSPDDLPSITGTPKTSDFAGTPSPTPVIAAVPELPEICQPFPDEIYGIEMASTGGFFVNARCHGEDISFQSPVGRATFLDYTALTGRLAYSQSIRLPSDLSSQGGDVWIYDFWTDEKTMWLDGGVTAASWAPIRDPAVDKQYLAILEEDGSLSLGAAPFVFRELASVNNVCWFSWSPLADQIVYVKDCSEISDGSCYRYTVGTSYLMKIDGGQPRKLAGATNEIPIWALDYRALIIPGTPVKIYHLDEAKLLPLSLPNGEPLDGARMGGFRWSPSNRFLFMSQYDCFDHIGWWIVELSEDLNQAINFTMMVHFFDFQYPSQDELLIRSPSDHLEYLGKILSLETNTLRMSIVLREYGAGGFGNMEVVFAEDSLILDAQGNRTDYSALAEGMYIDFLGRALTPDTLTLIATRIHIVAPTSEEVTYRAEIIRIHPELQHATIQISQPEFSMYSDQRGLTIAHETQLVDEKGGSMTFQDLQEGMSIEVVGSSISSDPFAILATTIRILDE
jgi:hypothetical protein